MNTGKLDVLADGIGYDFTVFCHSIHLNFLVVFVELAHHHRVLLADVGSQLEETFQLFLVGADVHGCTAEHVRRTHQDWETDFLNEGVDIVHRGEGCPCWLIHTDAVAHGGELVAVFGIVNAFGRSAENGDTFAVETHGKVVGDLSTCGNNHAMRVLQFDDVHHTLEGEFVKVEAVAHVVVGGDCLRVVVDHHRTVAILPDSVKCLNTTPVKLYT